jgi:hypothetical protein
MKTLQEKIDQIAEMSEVMRKAVELDEKNAHDYEERLKMLEIENRGLKELLKIKTTYGVKEITAAGDTTSTAASTITSSSSYATAAATSGEDKAPTTTTTTTSDEKS